MIQTKNLYPKTLFVLVFISFLLNSCGEINNFQDQNLNNQEFDHDQNNASENINEQIQENQTQSDDNQFDQSMITKWDLWGSGQTQLRGANIWQALVILELDGDTFKGSGYVGPPYSQQDFYDMAALGANYVTISGPGIFTEEPPFVVDQQAVEHLDNLLAMIAEADMFAVISFRTGPGRSECTFWCEEDDPVYEDYFNDTMWEDQDAQDAWVDMWQFTAERYGGNPIVVGYKLMVEPNAPPAIFDIWDPEEFYDDYAGTLYDWNQLYPRLVSGIRQVDTQTPILVNADGFSAIEWLPFLKTIDDPKIVYIVHQYHPFDEYTHQETDSRNEYPGSLDLDWDGNPDDFNQEWMDEELLFPVDEFSEQYGVVIGVDEFGLNRWVPGAAIYMDELMELFENRGMNYSIWAWPTSWPEFEEEVHAMNFLLGPDPDNRSPVDNDLQDVIAEYWSLNTIRPSTISWEE